VKSKRLNTKQATREDKKLRMENRRRKAERKVTGKQLQTEKERDPKKN
jgi:hypothetical protein